MPNATQFTNDIISEEKKCAYVNPSAAVFLTANVLLLRSSPCLAQQTPSFCNVAVGTSCKHMHGQNWSSLMERVPACMMRMARSTWTLQQALQ